MQDQFNVMQAGTLSPEDYAQQQLINRQQRFADMLMQQGQQPQGQMISGRYVAPSFFQMLNPVANQLAGAYIGKQSDTEAAKLAEKIRAGKMAKEEEITNYVTGTPEKATELAGPYAGNVPMPMAVAPATKPDLAAALKAINTNNPYGAGSEYKAALVGNMIPKKTDQLINYEAYKAETPEGKRLSFTDWSDRNEKQRLEIDRQRLAIEQSNANKPQIIETANGYVAVNPRNPNQATPVMLNGQAVVGSKSNLPEGATGQVTGVQNVKSALNDLKTNLKNFNTFDMVNPNKRALIATDYQNAILQLKEAMKLGVLNGNDYAILTSMITDPNSPKALLIDKKTQMQQIANLESKLDQMTTNVFKTHGRNVPSNLMPTTNPVAAPSTQIDPALLQYMTPEQRKLFGG